MEKEHVLFVMRGIWQPFLCRHEGCKNENANIIKLTREEWELLPEKKGSAAADFIFENKLGKAVCREHSNS